MDLHDENTNVAAAGPQLPAEKQAPVKTPMARRKKLILIISACAVAVIAAAVALTLILVEAANSAKYEQAVALMDSNDLLGAKDEFLTVGGYKDSSEKAKECQNRFDFNSADALLRSEDYAGARDIFAALGDYSNAPVKLNECDYNIAAALLKDGEPEKAKAAFLALGNYSDSAKQALQCQNEIDYLAATDDLSKGEYLHAFTVFTRIKDYRDSKYQAGVCTRNIDYDKAVQLLADGKFYDAYSEFKALGSFKDSVAKMDECIQENPLPGEIYRNPDFAKKASGFMLKSLKDEYIRCIRIYKENTLVSTIFVSNGKKISIKLPAGTYSIRYAIGVNWFGPEGLFGDDGFYCELLDKNGKNTFKFSSSRGWWFDLRDVYTISAADATILDRSSF